MQKPRQHYNVTLAVLATAALAYALLQTMVAPALPAIQEDLHASTTSVTWVLTVYLLTASVATPIVGRLGDIYGKERVLVMTLSVFGLGALIAAAILLLATAMKAWLAALIVAVVLFAAAGVLALLGRQRVHQATPPVPQETVRNVKADIDEVKERAQR